MKDFKTKYIDKFAHIGVGCILAFIIIAILTFINFSLWSVNLITFISSIVVAFLAEFKDEKDGGKADEFDIIATVFGALIILMTFNYF